MKEETITITPAEALSACLQWATSPRGGNNFYGRILNGCGRHAAPGLGTAAVALDTRGRYLFLWDPDWFVSLDSPFQLMAIVHEAAHLILKHLERGLRIKQRMNDNPRWERLRNVVNVAQDMTANDIAVRPMIQDGKTKFKNYEKDFIFPEARSYPKGLTFEEYLALLLEDLENHGFSLEPTEEDVEKAKKNFLSVLDRSGEGEEGDGEGEEKGEGGGGGGGGTGFVLFFF